VVLPVAAASRWLLLCPLSIINKNDNNGNDDRVPSMIVAVKDVVWAPSKFLGEGYDDRHDRSDYMRQQQQSILRYNLLRPTTYLL
jgi:hypothetical protein